MRLRAVAAALTLTAFAPSVIAADIVLTPPAGGGVTVTNAAGDTTRFRAGEDGTVLMNGNVGLVESTATTGNILKGGVPFIHNFGAQNTFMGENAGNFTMTGNFNTASGNQALNKNTTGSANTANGSEALLNNTIGNSNTANGALALVSNTTGLQNTASGAMALDSNTTGNDNTATGFGALADNKTGFNNTALGSQAMDMNSTGRDNSATGYEALYLNMTGFENAATGSMALHLNGAGAGNTAVGFKALYSNTDSYNSTAVGAQALVNSTGAGNVAIGAFSGSGLTTGNNNIDIDNGGLAGESGTIRIGDSSAQTKTYIAGIYGATLGGGNAVFVNSLGQLGNIASSRRFKDDIADMGGSSSALMKLRPVTFRYKPEVDDGSRLLQYGLIAEEVEAVYPGMVAHDADGKVQTVRYQFLAPMLLNEYQKQQRTIQAQANHLAQLEQERWTQTAEIARLKQAVAKMAVVVDQLQRNATVTAGLEFK